MESISEERTGGFRWVMLAGDDGQVLALSGELDLAGAPAFGEATRLLLLGAGDPLIDLHELTFIDSSGIETIVRTIGSLAPSGRSLRLSGLRGHVARVLELVGILPSVSVVPRPASAVAWSNGEAPA